MRRYISPKVKRELISFFRGKVCVVDGTSSNVDWHHLDDNSSNTGFENLIPLKHEYNLRLAQYANESKKELPLRIDPILSPGMLNFIAERNLFLGRPWLSFGASRLASFISINYLKNNINETLLISSNTIHYLRHCYNEKMIYDLLERNIFDVLINKKGSVKNIAKFRLFFEFGSLFQDFGEIDLSFEMYEKCLLLPKVINSPDFEYCYQAVLRRQALNYAWKKNFLKASDLIEQSYSDYKKVARFINHYNASKAKLEYAKNNIFKALDLFREIKNNLVDESGCPNYFASTFWNSSSILVRFALLTVKSKEKRLYSSAEQALIDASIILNKSGSKLNPLLLSGEELSTEIMKILPTLNLTNINIPVFPRHINRKVLKLIQNICKGLK